MYRVPSGRASRASRPRVRVSRSVPSSRVRSSTVVRVSRGAGDWPKGEDIFGCECFILFVGAPFCGRHVATEATGMVYGLAVDAVPWVPILDPHSTRVGVVLLGGYELPPSFEHFQDGRWGVDVDVVDSRFESGVWDNDV